MNPLHDVHPDIPGSMPTTSFAARKCSKWRTWGFLPQREEEVFLRPRVRALDPDADADLTLAVRRSVQPATRCYPVDNYECVIPIITSVDVSQIELFKAMIAVQTFGKKSQRFST